MILLFFNTERERKKDSGKEGRGNRNETLKLSGEGDVYLITCHEIYTI
jgi:hypothetical protein